MPGLDLKAMASVALVAGFLSSVALLMAILDRLEPDAPPPRPRAPAPRRHRCAAGRTVAHPPPRTVATGLCGYSRIRGRTVVPSPVTVRIPLQRSVSSEPARCRDPEQGGMSPDAVHGSVVPEQPG